MTRLAPWQALPAVLLLACLLLVAATARAADPTPTPTPTLGAPGSTDGDGIVLPRAEDRSQPPKITAPAAIVMEASTGDVAYARQANERRPIASTTKLMTALLTAERAKLSQVCTASSYRPAPVESQIGLIPGERMTVADLLRGLMLESGNDAAMTLAQCVGGSTKAFVALMNAKAVELGLTNTHYSNPIGLDGRRNYSTAHDLAVLALELRRSSPFVRKIMNRTKATLTSGDHPRTFANRNTLLEKAPWINGMKTGHTNTAGYILVGSGTRHGVTLVAVVLDDPSEAARNADALALLQWGMTRFVRITPVRADETEGQVAIRYRRGATLDLVTAGTVRRVVPRGTRITTRNVGLPDRVTGPVRRGQQFGVREVYADGVKVASVPIVAADAVPEAGFGQRTKDLFTRPLPIIAVIAFVSASVMLVRRARRGPPRRGRTARSEPEAA
jgi:D-alanyl-D-alanine carboxypeptidase (penicillin-binding protein 5/6)